MGCHSSAPVANKDSDNDGKIQTSSGNLKSEKESVHPYLLYGCRFNEADPKNTDTFKYLIFDEMPKLTPKHTSSMAKFLTPELFAKLKNVKSSKGYTLSNTIQTGVVTPHLGNGATAGDEECWDLFKDLFYPMIKKYHGYDPATQKHPTDLNPSNLKFTPEQAEKFGKYVVSTRVRAARNICGFALPAGATDKDRAGVESLLKEVFAGFSGELAGTYYPLAGMSKDTEKDLLDQGFLFQIPGGLTLLTGAGAARNWPHGRGIFHNDAKTALAWVNEEDQCRIISMEKGGNIPSVFTRFCAISSSIKSVSESKGLKLMWSENLGFLGTCPSNLGTGLRASVMVVLKEFNALMESTDPVIKSKKLNELLDVVCAGFDLQPRGSSGEHSPAVGAKFDVSNKQRLGFSEVQLVQKMIDGVTKVIALEERLAAASNKIAEAEKIMAEVKTA